MFLHFVSASVLQFDDSEKQRVYETISFKEVHIDILEIKVAPTIIDLLASKCSGFPSGLSVSCSMRRS